MRKSEGTRTPDPEQVLGYLLARASDHVGRRWDAALRGHDINPRQFSVLAWLAFAPGLSSAELARRVMITPQSMSEMLATLESLGLVVRTSESTPGKAIALEITALGRRLLDKAMPLVHQANEGSFGHLSSRERQTFRTLLLKILAT